MLLVKCSCGCLFTVKDDAIPTNGHIYTKCHNCENEVEYYPNNWSLQAVKSAFSQANMTVQKIPDDAKITITFDA